LRSLRYAAVGALCAVITNVSVVGLVQHGFSSLTASLLAFGPVLLTGYGLHAAFTFATPPSRASFMRYAMATLANFPLWAFALYLFGDLLNCPIVLVAPAVTAVLFLWNYLSARWAFGPRILHRGLPWV
jgi:putative flippase GtrA